MVGPGWLGGAALGVAALVYDALLGALRRSDRAFPSTRPAESMWWFGYARDLANLLGFLLFAVGFRLLDLPWPRALLAAALMTLLAYGLDYFFGRVWTRRRAEVVLAAALLALVIAVSALRDAIFGGLDRLVRGLF
jgi:hypothetical protein